MTPTASLVIATYNHAHLLPGAITSGLTQTLRDVEIVVVDDGSTDETPMVLKRYGDRLRSLRQPNRGLAAARNAGLAVARGRYVAFLDADDVVAPTKVERQAAILEADATIAWTYCDVRIEREGTGQATTASARFGYRSRRLDGWIFPELVGGNFIPAIAPLIRRSALDRAGPFDEELTALEDWDLWLRLALVGEVRYDPAVGATYRQRAGGMSQDRARMDANRFRVLDKLGRTHPRALRALGLAGRRIVADTHNWFGYAACRRGDWPEASRRLACSLRALPWQGRAPVLLGLALLRRWVA